VASRVTCQVFPVTRLRDCAVRRSFAIYVSETRLSPDAFAYPHVRLPGEGVRKEVRSMPGVFNLSVGRGQ